MANAMPVAPSTTVITTLQLADAQVDLRTGEVRRPAGPLTLSPLERGLLTYLAARPGQVVPDQELLDRVWGYRRVVATRTLTTTMGRRG